jgi:hypothetical protein
MINILLWSKDRAAQLDLTLQSYKKYFKDWDKQTLNILYKCSSDDFIKSYDILMKYHPEFNWVNEKDLVKQTKELIFNTDHLYVSFIVDDDVFIDYFSTSDYEFKEFTTNNDIACLSCRLAPYINYCYTAGMPQPAPDIKDGIWEWCNKPYDWGYPASLSAFHVFRKQDVSFLKDINFRGVNTFEAQFDSMFSRNRTKMICYNQAKCICATNNRVQMENANKNENSHDIYVLNNAFLLGKRLSTNVNDKATINMCHSPMKYIFEENYGN